MKRLLILTNVLWLSIFIFFSCTRNGGLQASTDDCQSFCYNFSLVPFPGLTSFATKVMSKNYHDLIQIPNPQSNLQGASPTIDDPNETRSVWFSLETMKNFMYQIERSSCQLKCDSSNFDRLGIRFYFAKYPLATDPAASNPSFAFLSTNPQYYGRKTLFMVPTYHSNNKEVDFDPTWSAKNKDMCAPKQLSQIMDKASPQQQFLILSPLSNPDPTGKQNHGGICPPDNCPD